MEAILVGVFLACLATIFWALQTVTSEHRARLNEIKPRILDILNARIAALERGETSSNTFQITTEELKNLSECLSYFKKYKLNKEIEKYSEVNIWNFVHGVYTPENPKALLSSCKTIRKLIM